MCKTCSVQDQCKLIARVSRGASIAEWGMGRDWGSKVHACITCWVSREI